MITRLPASIGFWALMLPLWLSRILYSQTRGIEGRVTDIVTHQGVAGVAVEVHGQEDYTKAYSALTGETGSFAIPNMKPGPYFARFKHASFADSEVDGESEREFVISPSAGSTVLQVELVRRAGLSGRLMDRDGRPMPGVPVKLIRVRYPGSYSEVTDPAGRFAFTQIRPTAYLLAAEPSLAYLYYPGVPERGQGTPIVLRPGAEVAGYEFRLPALPLFRVRGRVLNEAGQALAGVSVRLKPRENDQSDLAHVESGPDGDFEFTGVGPGNWICSAEWMPEASKDASPVVPMPTPAEGKTVIDEPAIAKNMESPLEGFAQGMKEFAEMLDKLDRTPVGDVSFTVSHDDVENLEVRLTVPFAFLLSGFREEVGTSAPGVAPVSARLVRIDGVAARGTGFYEGPVEKIYRGRYRVVAGDPEPGYYLASATLGGRDVLGQVVDLAPGSPGMQFVYRADGGVVAGTVEEGANAVVVLLPQDEALLRVGPLARARADRTGARFHIGSLRPGKYYAWAFEYADLEALTDPSFVRSLIPGAVAVEVKSRETTSVQLRTTRWPE